MKVSLSQRISLSLLLVLAVVAGTLGGSLVVSAQSAVAVDGQWARAASAGHNSAAYMTITNNSSRDVVIVGAAADVADRVEIHETTMELTMVDGRLQQIMRMEQVDRIVVPAHGAVELRPGGLHVMFLELYRDLEEGDAFVLTLLTADGGAIVIDVPVSVFGAGADDHDHHHHDH